MSNSQMSKEPRMYLLYHESSDQYHDAAPRRSGRVAHVRDGHVHDHVLKQQVSVKVTNIE